MLEIRVIAVGSSVVLERTEHHLVMWKLLTRPIGERKTQMVLFVNDRVICKCIYRGQSCTLTLSQLPVHCL